jgi:hypothetical protein
MWKITLKIADSRELAERIHAIQNTNDEIKFATYFDTDETGAALESSTGDWWGAKFIEAFDATFLFFAEFGGGGSCVFDVEAGVEIEELQAGIEQVFQKFSIERVCVEESEWYEEKI